MCPVHFRGRKFGISEAASPMTARPHRRLPRGWKVASRLKDLVPPGSRNGRGFMERFRHCSQPIPCLDHAPRECAATSSRSASTATGPPGSPTRRINSSPSRDGSAERTCGSRWRRTGAPAPTAAARGSRSACRPWRRAGRATGKRPSIAEPACVRTAVQGPRCVPAARLSTVHPECRCAGSGETSRSRYAVTTSPGRPDCT